MMIDARECGFGLCWCTSGPRESKLTWAASAIAFSPAVTMFRRRMFGAATNEVLRICQRADHTILFDNSTEEGYRLVAVLGPSVSQWFEPVPGWAAANHHSTGCDASEK